MRQLHKVTEAKHYSYDSKNPFFNRRKTKEFPTEKIRPKYSEYYFVTGWISRNLAIKMSTDKISRAKCTFAYS